MSRREIRGFAAVGVSADDDTHDQTGQGHDESAEDEEILGIDVESPVPVALAVAG